MKNKGDINMNKSELFDKGGIDLKMHLYFIGKAIDECRKEGQPFDVQFKLSTDSYNRHPTINKVFRCFKNSSAFSDTNSNLNTSTDSIIEYITQSLEELHFFITKESYKYICTMSVEIKNANGFNYTYPAEFYIRPTLQYYKENLKETVND